MGAYRRWSARFSGGGVAICLSAILSAAGPVTVQAKAAKSAIPFQEAVVTSPDNKVFTIEWRAPGVRRVLVFVGTDPDHIDKEHPVGAGADVGEAVVSGLAPAPRWYFQLTPDRGEPLVVADRTLHLTTASNFRDAGGYRTLDGRWVRMGVAYRSNGLEKLSDSDAEVMGSLHLKLITDLRTDEERQSRPDRTPEGVPDLQADVLRDNSEQVHLMMTNPAALAAQMQHSDLHEVYREFVDLGSARSAYGTLFRRLADDVNAPSVFHCTAGKDRTGWAEAVLLTILGVPRTTIFSDYELTNVYLSRAAIESLRPANAQAGALPQRRLLADPADLRAAFDEVNLRYGSFDRYLHQGLGLTDADLKKIRRNFLVG